MIKFVSLSAVDRLTELLLGSNFEVPLPCSSNGQHNHTGVLVISRCQIHNTQYGNECAFSVWLTKYTFLSDHCTSCILLDGQEVLVNGSQENQAAQVHKSNVVL